MGQFVETGVCRGGEREKGRDRKKEIEAGAGGRKGERECDQGGTTSGCTYQVFEYSTVLYYFC